MLAHELSHIGNYDTRVMTLAVVLVGAVGIWRTSACASAGAAAPTTRRRWQHPAVAGFVLIPLTLVANLMKFAISRHREYLADASGARSSPPSGRLACALEKIRDAATPVERTSVATNHLSGSLTQKAAVNAWAKSRIALHPSAHQ